LGRPNSPATIARMKEVFSHRLDEQLIGKVFGRLLVVKHIGRPPTHKLTHYECICECGKSVITPGSYLLDGHKKSCGCLYKEMWDGIRKPEGAAAKKSLYNSDMTRETWFLAAGFVTIASRLLLWRNF
jgi:hypothetical protein